MKVPSTSRVLVIGALAAASVLAFASVPAAAQDYGPDGAYTTGEVIVHPGHARDPFTGAEIDTVRTQRVVYARDLDLDTRWGQHALKRRIERAASDACDYLDSHYVTVDSESRDCIKDAVSDAMEQAEAMVGHPLYAWRD
jgi:UrcA family protein